MKEDRSASSLWIEQVAGKRLFHGPLEQVKKFSLRVNLVLNLRVDSLISAAAQSRTCLWVSAGPRNGEEAGTVPGPNRSSRFNGQPMDRGHLEATTVRAFLVSTGCPKAGVLKRHTFIAGSAEGTSLSKAEADRANFRREAGAQNVRCDCDSAPSTRRFSQPTATSFVHRGLSPFA